MSLFRKMLAWLERMLFTGEVLRDYDVLHTMPGGVGTRTVRALLCRRGGVEKLVLRITQRSMLGVGVRYQYFDATRNVAAQLRQIAADLKPQVQAAPENVQVPDSVERDAAGRLVCPICHGFNPADTYRCQRRGKQLAQPAEKASSR